MCLEKPKLGVMNLEVAENVWYLENPCVYCISPPSKVLRCYSTRGYPFLARP
jgi:hypothetical protein